MVIDPKVEEPTRDLLEHAIRGELDELTQLMAELGPDRMDACLIFCLRVSGYIVIDISGHKWPSEADLREIAQRMAAVDLDFNLEESDVYALLARAAIGFEPLFDVFPDKEGRAVMVPVLTTAALLASYRRSPRHWWEYLDAIEQALEQAAPLPEETVPACCGPAATTPSRPRKPANARPGCSPAVRTCALNPGHGPVQAAGAWKCQMTSDGWSPAARIADGR